MSLKVCMRIEAIFIQGPSVEANLSGRLLFSFCLKTS
uniref:Uncharacterized protein n=1 Tax=Rhizophora mucronata TaxID=61149 RepID=A0A2P2PAJ9_RHIMU